MISLSLIYFSVDGSELSEALLQVDTLIDMSSNIWVATRNIRDVHVKLEIIFSLNDLSAEKSTCIDE